MNIQGKRALWLTITVLLAIACVPAAAEETAAAQEDWQFELAPFYLWVWTINGDQTIGARTADIKVDLTDLASGLEVAFVANFQGFYKNRWGFFIDYNYAKFSEDGYQGPIYLDATIKMHLVEVDGLYRFIPAPDHSLDLKAGARYIGMDPTVKLYPPRRFQEVGESHDWVDPVVGMRWIWQFADQWKLALLGDIGGFGVGSDFTCQGAFTIDWKPFEHASFRAGYRAIYVDYEDGTRSTPDYFNFDATLYGPMFGVSFYW
jgi:hypothetical protein